MDIPSATRQLHKIFECGRKAGIGHAMYLNFGTLLGVVRDNGLIPWDDDTDVSVMSDWITPEQEQAFYTELCKADVFKYRRRRAYRVDTNRALWWSCRSELHGCKSCIWFTFKWRNHVYHCKGKRWLRKIGLKPEVSELISGKLQDYTTIMKGNSAECFEKMREVKFLGGRFNIPFGAGTLLDEYYPNWAVPKQGGASSRYRIVIIADWSRENSWKIIA